MRERYPSDSKYARHSARGVPELSDADLDALCAELDAPPVQPPLPPPVPERTTNPFQLRTGYLLAAETSPSAIAADQRDVIAEARVRLGAGSTAEQLSDACDLPVSIVVKRLNELEG